MKYKKYIARRKAYIKGKLYEPGDVVDHFPGMEKRKSFNGIGEPIETEVTPEEPETEKKKKNK